MSRYSYRNYKPKDRSDFMEDVMNNFIVVPKERGRKDPSELFIPRPQTQWALLAIIKYYIIEKAHINVCTEEYADFKNDLLSKLTTIRLSHVLPHGKREFNRNSMPVLLRELEKCNLHMTKDNVTFMKKQDEETATDALIDLRSDEHNIKLIERYIRMFDMSFKQVNFQNSMDDLVNDQSTDINGNTLATSLIQMINGGYDYHDYVVSELNKYQLIRIDLSDLISHYLNKVPFMKCDADHEKKFSLFNVKQNEMPLEQVYKYTYFNTLMIASMINNSNKKIELRYDDLINPFTEDKAQVVHNVKAKMMALNKILMYVESCTKEVIFSDEAVTNEINAMQRILVYTLQNNKNINEYTRIEQFRTLPSIKDVLKRTLKVDENKFAAKFEEVLNFLQERIDKMMPLEEKLRWLKNAETARAICNKL